MTIEELCERREELQNELAWIELEITRAREKENGKAKELNNAAQYFPRVRCGATIDFVNHLKR